MYLVSIKMFSLIILIIIVVKKFRVSPGLDIPHTCLRLVTNITIEEIISGRSPENAQTVDWETHCSKLWDDWNCSLEECRVDVIDAVTYAEIDAGMNAAEQVSNYSALRSIETSNVDFIEALMSGYFYCRLSQQPESQEIGINSYIFLSRNGATMAFHLRTSVHIVLFINSLDGTFE